ncbi:MAG TPA: hypothetical protein DDZ80_29275 [Cyanobacteria bacterium UBA8803]|nr:hypothetical protein [Cyanobacteria bacterium UBA8803]
MGVWEESADFPTADASVVAYGQEGSPMSQSETSALALDSLINFPSRECELKRWKKIQKKLRLSVDRKLLRGLKNGNLRYSFWGNIQKLTAWFNDNISL